MEPLHAFHRIPSSHPGIDDTACLTLFKTLPLQMEFVPPYTDAKDGRNAVLRFYHAFNNRDLDAMMAEFADDVFYEDLVRWRRLSIVPSLPH